MNLRSKLTSEICQKIRSTDEKTEQNRLKAHTLPPFSQENDCIYWKTIKAFRFFIIKNKCTYKFYAFTIKSAFGNTSESIEFRFENIFKTTKVGNIYDWNKHTDENRNSVKLFTIYNRKIYAMTPH